MPAWTRKYRPSNLDEYIGNESVKKKIGNLVKINRLPQTVMFEGERGTGKTSMARLLAKTLMCENLQDGHPCEECRYCTQFKDYLRDGKAPRGLPVYEHDITKLNRREDATNIVERMSARAVGGSKRVHILDEVQRATSEAQSSFLKIAEEPIEGLYIIMCTTDPEDLLVPLRSRFNKFRIRKPTTEDIVTRLEHICEEEGVNYQQSGLRLLADAHNNNPRETINKAELIGLTGDITLDAVSEELSIVQDTYYKSFLKSVQKGSLPEVVQTVDSINSKGDIDLTTFVKGLGAYLVELMKIRSGVRVSKYSTKELKSKRVEVKQFSDSELSQMMLALSKYGNIKDSQEYQVLSLALDYMNILNVEETEAVTNITETEAGMEYYNTTQEVKKQRPVKKVVIAEESDVLSIFGSGVRRLSDDS